MYRTKNKNSEAIPTVDTGAGQSFCVSFTGRRSEDIGITYPMSGIVRTKGSVVLALYDAGYELVSIDKITPIGGKNA